MKILQVIDRLNIGGAERVLVDLSNLLHEYNVSVEVMFLLYPGPMESSLNTDIPRFTLSRTSKFSIQTFYKCAQHLRKFDIIHCHQRYVYSYIKLAALMFGIRSKIVLHDHFGPIDIDKSIPLGLRWVLKPKYFIGVSNTLTTWAKQQLALKDQNIFLLPNIIRKRFSGSAEKIYDLILVSNIKPIKNQLFAIALAKRINRKLLLIGQVQDESYFDLVKQQSAGANIEIITNCDNVHPYIARSRFGLHVSTSETGPLALIEYLAYGIPFLVYDTGEVAAVCKQTFPQMVINNFNADDWIKHMDFIESTNDTGLYDKLVDYYTSHFNDSSYLHICLKIYEHVSQDSL